MFQLGEEAPAQHKPHACGKSKKNFLASINEQLMTLEDIHLIVSILALILGLVGGIPQILRWLKSKPHLKITKIQIKEKPENGVKIDLEVKNEKKWWKRNSDATDVKVDWYIIDRHHEQWSASHMTLSPYLVMGARITKEFSSSHKLRRERMPHTMIILVKCREGVARRKEITFPPLTVR